MRTVSLLLLAVFLVAACEGTGTTDATPTSVPGGVDVAPPSIPGRADPMPAAAGPPVERLLDQPLGPVNVADVDALAETGDPRVGWVLVDLLAVRPPGQGNRAIVEALDRLTGRPAPVDADPWVHHADLLLGWDVPEPPGYAFAKRATYIAAEPALEPFFELGADLDWRQVTWRGVAPETIPPLDDPEVVPAAAGPDGDWLPATDLVVGVAVGDEARAYPQRVLEVHEVVNDDLGGRSIAVTFSPLGRAPIAYRAERDGDAADPIRLRTSGLALRSGSLLFDESSTSLVHQVDGRARSGDLQARKITLERIPTVTTTWAEWKEAHPETTVVSADGGVGRVYVEAPLGDRAALPELPIGAVDEAVAANEELLGVLAPDGSPVAFPVGTVELALASGNEVTLAGTAVVEEAGGLLARDARDGRPLPGHRVQWYAWSQAYPDTLVWDG